MKNMNKYDILADYLSDHLWQVNNLDYDFIKDFTHQSFSKTKEGVISFTDNSFLYDKEFCNGKNVLVFECLIEGFDIQAALHFFKNNNGLTEKTVKNFIGEEEVLAFSYTNLRRYLWKT